MPPDQSEPSGRSGVIHDLGYRPYAGPRGGEGPIARSLWVTGLRNAFGLGRSGRSKILPFVLIGLNLLPALIIVAVMVTLSLTELPVAYAQYAGTTQVLVSVFTAAQAPILFSRDLRYGSLVMYLARPVRPETYATIRWASLVTAILVFLVTPILVLYLGALLSDADVSDQTSEAAQAVALSVVLAGMLASVGGLISAWSTRRGFAVVATIGVLGFGFGVVAAVQGVALDQDEPRVGEWAGLLSPYSLYRGLAESLLEVDAQAITPPEGPTMELAYVAAAVVVLLGGLALLWLRYRRVAAR